MVKSLAIISECVSHVKGGRVTTPEELEQENKKKLAEAVSEFKTKWQEYKAVFANKDKLENDKIEETENTLSDALQKVLDNQEAVTSVALDSDKELSQFLGADGKISTDKVRETANRIKIAHQIQYAQREEIDKLREKVPNSSLVNSIDDLGGFIDEYTAKLGSKFDEVLKKNEKNQSIVLEKDKLPLKIETAQEINEINNKVKDLKKNIDQIKKDIEKSNLDENQKSAYSEYIKAVCQEKMMKLNMLKSGLKELQSEKNNKKLIDFRDNAYVGTRKVHVTNEKFYRSVDNINYAKGMVDGEEIVRFRISDRPGDNIATFRAILPHIKGKNPIAVTPGPYTDEKKCAIMSINGYFDLLIIKNITGENDAANVKVAKKVDKDFIYVAVDADMGLFLEAKNDYIKDLKEKFLLNNDDPVIVALEAAKNKDDVDAALTIKIDDPSAQHNKTLVKIGVAIEPKGGVKSELDNSVKISTNEGPIISTSELGATKQKPTETDRAESSSSPTNPQIKIFSKP